MGGRGDAGGGGVAGILPGEGRGRAAIGLGGGVLFGGGSLFFVCGRELARDVLHRNHTGVGGAAGAVEGEGAGTMEGGEGGGRDEADARGAVHAGAPARHAGGGGARVCGGVWVVGSDELDAVADPRAAGAAPAW